MLQDQYNSSMLLPILSCLTDTHNGGQYHRIQGLYKREVRQMSLYDRHIRETIVNYTANSYTPLW